MNMMITEVYDALISANAEELKARDAARVLADLDLASRDEFSALREDNQAMRTEMAELSGSLRGEMAALNGSLREDMQKLRTELKSDMAGLRTELKSEMAGLRTELKSDLAGMRTELTTIKWMFGVLVGVFIAIAFRVYTA